MGAAITNQKNILLFGGYSEERLVSVASAQNLVTEFRFDQLLFQSVSGEIYEVSVVELLAHQDVFKTPFQPREARMLSSNLEACLPLFKKAVVFLGYHGSQGEDGKVQAWLEDQQIFYTGSGALSSEQSFEKHKAKKIMLQTDVKMAPSFVIERSDLNGLSERLIAAVSEYGQIVIKPIASGSSFGLQFLSHPEAAAQVIEQIQKESFASYLVEAFVSGRELTVGVAQWGNELVALPASEVIMNEGHRFDYEGKYLGTGSKEITPADLKPDQLQMAQSVALKAHKALGCYGYSRTDMILTDKGICFLETNTLPGLSKPSFLPQQLRAAGYLVSNFIAQQIQLAQKRYLKSENELI